MEEKELKQECLKLMEAAEAAYLSTIDGNGFPQVRAMLNLRNKEQFGGLTKLFDDHREDFVIYLTTNTSSPKMDQIRANPKVSIYFCSPTEFHGFMLCGSIEIVKDQPLKKQIWRDGWEMYYPSGVDDPEYTILCLRPAFAKGWCKEGPFGFEICAKK